MIKTEQSGPTSVKVWHEEYPDEYLYVSRSSNGMWTIRRNFRNSSEPFGVPHASPDEAIQSAVDFLEKGSSQLTEALRTHGLAPD